MVEPQVEETDSHCVLENNAPKARNYRPEIDGLRGFAVAAVIANHFNKDILPGGYLGVDVFFVISGYVITSSLFGRQSANFIDFISGFYERRVKRLVPALSAFVLIMGISICLFNPSPNISLQTGLASLLGYSNLFLLKQSTDYFAESTELNIFTHTWSLGIEEQFYILFPFLVWFSGFSRQTKNGARNLFLIVGTLTIASLAGFLYIYPINQPAAYFLMPSRFWEMSAGCLVFIGLQKRLSIYMSMEKVPPLLVVTLILGVMHLPFSMAAISTIAVVALSSILIVCLKKQTVAFKIFTNPKVVYLGLISYSLYLWHWGVLSLSRWTIGIYWWSVPFQIALMLGLAAASYRWIETPLRKRKWLGKQWKTLVLGGVVLLIASGGIVALAKPLKGRLLLNTIPKQLLKDRDIGTEYGGNVCNIFSVDLDNTNLTSECGIFTGKTRKTLWNIGDSHSQRFSPAINKIASESNLNSVNLWGNSCLFPQAVRSSYTHASMQGKDCFALSGKVERVILNELNDGDVVIISVFSVVNKFAHLHKFEGFKDNFSNSDKTSISSEEATRIYFVKLSSFLDSVSKKGATTVLYINPIRFDSTGHGDMCASYWFRSAQDNRCLLDLKTYNKGISMVRHAYKQLLEGHPKTIVVDAQSGDACSATHCDGYFYADTNHMHYWYASGLINRALSPVLGK